VTNNETVALRRSPQAPVSQRAIIGEAIRACRSQDIQLMFVRAELVDNGSPRRGNWLPELVANSPACNGIVPRGPRERYVGRATVTA
jgi:hypothetical protein